MNNPLGIFLDNLRLRTTATVTALLSAVAVILGQFGIIISAEATETVNVIAGILASVMVMLTGFFGKKRDA